MTQDQFAQAIRRVPFRPFAIRMVDGRTFTVDHPDFAASSRRGHEVTFYADDNTTHLLDGRLIAELVVVQEEETADAD
jgi:hypothetical protein